MFCSRRLSLELLHQLRLITAKKSMLVMKKSLLSKRIVLIGKQAKSQNLTLTSILESWQSPANSNTCPKQTAWLKKP